MEPVTAVAPAALAKERSLAAGPMSCLVGGVVPLFWYSNIHYRLWLHYTFQLGNINYDLYIYISIYIYYLYILWTYHEYSIQSHMMAGIRGMIIDDNRSTFPEMLKLASRLPLDGLGWVL